MAGHNFATAGNAFEVTRLGVEIGLLAIAMTPIIVTGGIDLSVGSMMGLAAVVLGALWHDAGLSLPLAITLTLLLGVAGGALNAVLITRLGFPPLIVTLGTLSLFRGIAEGATGGIQHYSGFPDSFLALGQGYVWGRVPAQLFIFLAAVAIGGWVLHRTSAGRALYAIGHSPEGARYAGIPVGRRLAQVYVVSGFAASLAAVIYVAHLGQAKSDAGTGYELMAITAVVLGGASIFGGSGTILGTVLGLFSIVLLQNGLRLAGQPAELSGILTGVLLVATIVVDLLSRRAKARPSPSILATEQLDVRNSQVGILSAVILAGALIVAASNWMLVRSLRDELRGAAPGGETSGAASGTTTTAHPVVAMMPKAKGDPYFISARQGADSAAQALGVELLWDGPTDLDPAKQNEVVEAWITRGVNAIAVSVENREAISTVLRKARDRGIKVVTWDADAEKDARDFFVNQATPQGIANALTDEAARLLNGEGQFAIVTGALSAANQNEWIANIRRRLAEKYPKLVLATIRPSDDDRDKAFAETQTILRAYPAVKLVMAISAPAVPGAAEAVRQEGRSDVSVIGLSLPNINKPYVHDGIVQAVVLWNTRDLGYLTVYASTMLARKTLTPGATSMEAGRLGRIEIKGTEIVLGEPLLMNKENIDKYDF
ncbi:MAG TPA: substrate-binding domain-containing protein [Nannocystaceae bacterium]|nr:substrate-binding domain-containing protein [Nannocystaceae bacterium]